MALIYLREALMTGKRLPYDDEVEFLESTGTQYIDTGVLIDTSTDTVEITFMPHAETSGYQAYYGTDETGNGQFSLRKNTNGNNIQVLKGTGVSAGITADEKWHTVKVTPNKAIVDGIDIALTQADAQYTKSLMLFARITTADTITAYAKCRIASFKIYRNSTLVRDLIPVRKGTVGYLYDRVSGKLFGNAGTGDFVLGPDVVPVEYIESHGTEYIDTGVVPTTTSILRTSIRLMEAANNGCFVGALDGGAHRFHLNRSDFGLNGYFGYTNGNVQPFVDCNLELNAKEWYCKKDGVTTASTSTKVIPSVSVFLFARHYSSSYDRPVKARMGFCEILDNDLPVRSFRSVRVGTEGAMMDTLTRRIYRNAGTGAFGYGNDLKYPIPAE